MTAARGLLIVCVLALLGDNPMQSEFSCHIGLRGKFFCRVCGVKGKDAAATNPLGQSLQTQDSADESSKQSEVESVAFVGARVVRRPASDGSSRKVWRP